MATLFAEEQKRRSTQRSVSAVNLSRFGYTGDVVVWRGDEALFSSTDRCLLGQARTSVRLEHSNERAFRQDNLWRLSR